MNEQKPYRTAYVVQAAGYDFSGLKLLCESIKFITSGYESDTDLPQQIGIALFDFDPSRDLIVPVGNVASNLIVGIAVEALRKKEEQALGKEIRIAFYRDKHYTVWCLTKQGLRLEDIHER